MSWWEQGENWSDFDIYEQPSELNTSQNMVGKMFKLGQMINSGQSPSTDITSDPTNTKLLASEKWMKCQMKLCDVNFWDDDFRWVYCFLKSVLTWADKMAWLHHTKLWDNCSLQLPDCCSCSGNFDCPKTRRVDLSDHGSLTHIIHNQPLGGDPPSSDCYQRWDLRSWVWSSHGAPLNRITAIGAYMRRLFLQASFKVNIFSFFLSAGNVW
jgi:hypothetical protein